MLTFIYGLIRGIFAVLDKIVASLIEMLFDLMLSIADIDLFGNSTAVETLANNITILLGVFMLFKLSFSFLNYIINPDQFTDKSKGFAKIIQNVLITLVLLTSYNFIFDKAMYFQGIFLKENTVGRIILGGYGTGVIEVKSQARTVSFSVFSAFIQPSNTIRYVCNGYATIARQNGEAWNNCKNVLKNYDDDVTKYMNRDGTYYTIENQVQEIAKYDDTAGLLDNILRAKNGDEFAFDYMFFISGICGIFVAILLVNFCFDIAIRTIKLAFLRLMAPIPIISYIDPIKGEGIFKKWLTNVGKTYLDLFVRLMAIYFAIFIINVTIEVLGNGVSTYSGSTTASSNPLVMIFIIIGALMFAKQFPKLIQDITGINLGDGKFQLNPLKRIENDAIGGKAIHSAVRGARGLVTGAAFGTVGAFTGAGAMRGVSGAFSGLSAGLHGKKFGEIRKQQVDANARMRTAILDDSTFGGRTHERFSAFMGTGGRMTTITSQKHQINDRIKTIDVEIEAHEAENKIRQQSISSTNGKISDLTEAANSIKALEDRAKEKIQNGESAIGIAYLQRKNAVDVLKAKTITADAKSQAMLDKLIQQREATADATKRGRIQNLINYQEQIIKTDIATREKQLADEIAAAEAEANKYLNEQGMYEYMSGVINGTIGDASFSNMYETAVQKNNFAHIDISTMNGEQLHSSMGQTKGNIGDAQRGIAEIERDIKATEEQIKNKQSIKAKESEILHRIEKEQENPIKVNQDAIKH